MSMSTRKQIIRSNEDALAAFVSSKAEVDAMLTQLHALSDDHFGYSPDEVTWGHVGTLEALRRPPEAHHRQRLPRGRVCRVTPPAARGSAA